MKVLCFAFLLASALCCLPSLSSSQRITIPITIQNGTEVVVDTFGWAAGATRCLDPELGERESPPDACPVCFSESPCSIYGIVISLDYHPLCDTSTRNGRFVFHFGGPFGFNEECCDSLTILSWPSDLSLYLDSLQMSNIYTDQIVDMLKQSSDTVPTWADGIVFYGKPIRSYCLENVPDNLLTPISDRLLGNYPNPFNPSTRVDYSIASASYVELSVYDLLGRRLKIIESGRLQPGDHFTTWDGKNDDGKDMPSGVYFVRMSVEREHAVGYTALRKIALVR